MGKEATHKPVRSQRVPADGTVGRTRRADGLGCSHTKAKEKVRTAARS